MTCEPDDESTVEWFLTLPPAERRAILLDAMMQAGLDSFVLDGVPE